MSQPWGHSRLCPRVPANSPTGQTFAVPKARARRSRIHLEAQLCPTRVPFCPIHAPEEGVGQGQPWGQSLWSKGQPEQFPTAHGLPQIPKSPNSCPMRSSLVSLCLEGCDSPRYQTPKFPNYQICKLPNFQTPKLPNLHALRSSLVPPCPEGRSHSRPSQISIPWNPCPHPAPSPPSPCSASPRTAAGGGKNKPGRRDWTSRSAEGGMRLLPWDRAAPSSAAASPGAGRWQSPSSHGIPGSGKEPGGAPSSALHREIPSRGEVTGVYPAPLYLPPSSRIKRGKLERPLICLPSTPGLAAPWTKLWINTGLLAPVTAELNETSNLAPSLLPSFLPFLLHQAAPMLSKFGVV